MNTDYVADPTDIVLPHDADCFRAVRTDVNIASPARTEYGKLCYVGWVDEIDGNPNVKNNVRVKTIQGEIANINYTAFAVVDPTEIKWENGATAEQVIDKIEINKLKQWRDQDIAIKNRQIATEKADLWYNYRFSDFQGKNVTNEI